MNLNKYFDKIYVINLKKDVDKLKSFYQKIENLNIDVELFVGIDGGTLDFKSCNPEDVPNKVSFLENKYAKITNKSTKTTRRRPSLNFIIKYVYIII